MSTDPNPDPDPPAPVKKRKQRHDSILNPTKATVTINVSSETNAGGRRHMEDFVTVQLYPDKRFDDIPFLHDQIYLGVFDGHGGKEAASFAKKRLWEVIQNNPKFSMPQFVHVCESLEESFLALHKEMEPLRGRSKKIVCLFHVWGSTKKNGAQSVTTVSV